MDEAAVVELLDERPELESAVRSILDVDENQEAWTFDDVPVDSGAFGELVSKGVVERTGGGDGYRVADPAAVRAALDGEESAADDGGNGEGGLQGVANGGTGVRDVVHGETLADRIVAVDRRVVGAVAAALFVLVLARAHVYPSVFRDGAVVLSGNDPYFYRYLVDQGLAASGGGFDAATSGAETGEPLLVATLWAFSTLLGDSSGWVMAWYPVVAGLVTGLLVYLLAVDVTDDRRIGLAAVLLLAVTPGHAFRTSLGFADHHAFDYLWLALTAYALARLAAADGDWRDGRTIGFTFLLGVAMAGQSLAWDAGALLLVPVGVYAAVRTLHDVRVGASPLRAHLPLAAGVALAASLVLLAHVGLGWHNTPAAFAPTLLLVALVGVLVAGELAVRVDVPARALAVVEAAGFLVGVVALPVLFPEFWASLRDGLGRLAAARDIAETQALFGDALGWLLLFGFVLVLAIPYLVWASNRAYRGDSEWLVPVVYGWYFLGLALFQVRFTGQLAMFAAVFAGLGFVHLASVVDIARPPLPFAAESFDVSLTVPDRGTVLSLILLFVLVGGLSVVQTPIKNGQVTTDGDAYRAAAWMDGYADERGWVYPEDYVFSRWGKNRMYNYFVNGQSRSYGFAQNNYGDFASATDGDRWYRRLQGDVNLVVLEDRGYEAGSIHSRLYDDYGSHSEQGPGLAHYRAVYATDGGSRKVFTFVPGVRLTGPGEPNATYEVASDVTIDGASFTYTREVRTDGTGIYSVTVPYPGEYRFGDAQFDVSESAVRTGSILETFHGKGVAHWTFDEADGSTAYDRVGGRHGTIHQGERVPGPNGTAIALDGDGYVEAPSERGTTAEFTVSAWIRPNASRSGGILSTGKDGASRIQHGFLFDHGLSGWNSDSLGLYLGDGSSHASPVSNDLGWTYPATEYHHVAVVFDNGRIQWYADGELFDETSIDIERVAFADRPTYIGREYSGAGGQNRFDGAIDDVRFYREALDPSEVRSLADAPNATG